MFTKRISKPTKGNKSFIRKVSGGWNSCIPGYPADKDCNVLANCVGYANGRFNEIITELTGFQGNKYNTLNCNAESFIEKAKKAGLEVGQVPKPGAIAVWAKGIVGNADDGAGHVAIVEEVLDDNTIYTSESAYGISAFYNAKRSNSNGRWGIGSKYTFRGFIYNPAVKEEPTPKPEPKPEPTPTPSEEFKLGDKVCVKGYATAASDGSGSRTASYGGNPKDPTDIRYITLICEGAKRPYHISAGKTLHNADKGWVSKDQLTKVE